MNVQDAALASLIGYLFGSIPFGLLLTRAAGAGDLRSIGSGNIGATNVLRTGRKGLAALTLLLDLAKGLAAVLLARHFFPDAIFWAAAAAFLGHCYPLWLRFRGGKGVAIYAGIAFGLAWPLGLVYAATWIGILAMMRISSLAGLSAALAMPVAAWALGHDGYVPLLAALSLIVFWKHRDNIGRLLRGQEPRLGSSGA